MYHAGTIKHSHKVKYYYLNLNVPRIMAFWVILRGFGLLFYLLLGSR